MSGSPTVASVIAGDLARYGARRCFGLLGTANFKISHALVEAGVTALGLAALDDRGNGVDSR